MTTFRVKPLRMAPLPVTTSLGVGEVNKALLVDGDWGKLFMKESQSSATPPHDLDPPIDNKEPHKEKE